MWRRLKAWLERSERVPGYARCPFCDAEITFSVGYGHDATVVAQPCRCAIPERHWPALRRQAAEDADSRLTW